jgi:hypothetical protein
MLGPRELASHIIKTEGWMSLNRGYCATNLRDSVASMAYFSTYAWLKYQLLPPGMSTPMWSNPENVTLMIDFVFSR